MIQRVFSVGRKIILIFAGFIVQALYAHITVVQPNLVFR